MKERIPYLLEIYQAFKSDNVKSRLKHFDILTNSLFTLTQSLFDNKVQINDCDGPNFFYNISIFR